MFRTKTCGCSLYDHPIFILLSIYHGGIRRMLTRWTAIVFILLSCLSIISVVGQPGDVRAAQATDNFISTYIPITTGSRASTTASSYNPLSGLPFYVDPYSPARQQANEWRWSRPADAMQMEKIAAQPTAMWLGAWSGDVARSVDERVGRSQAVGALPLLVLYNIPQRDCGGQSAGGSASADAYRQWVRAVAQGIGARPAAVIVEPDALALLPCLSAADQQTRLALLRDAVDVLSALPRVAVYLDAGHGNWVGADAMAQRLQQAGIARAQGFALNVSNFVDTARNLAYGKALAARLGGKHFVIDTSRNGAGAAPDGEWCNPAGRALGPRPTSTTGEPLLDAYLWVKQPGESDGWCQGGPAAGTWWPDYALGLAQRAAY